ncbi:MAG: TIGR02466 family protein [Pseudobdellovibrio sp.]
MIQAFITHIYKDKLTSKPKKLKLMNELLDEVENLLASDLQGHVWSEKNYVSGYTSYGSVDKLHLIRTPFKDLEKEITTHLQKFILRLDYDVKPKDLTMTHCWVNVMPEGAQHTAHIHPLSVISGTFYLQIPKKASSIKFEDPRLGMMMNTPPPKLKSAKSNKRFVEISPSEGDLVLFESWLRHEVPRNLSKDPRISISFNYGWKPSR